MVVSIKYIYSGTLLDYIFIFIVCYTELLRHCFIVTIVTSWFFAIDKTTQQFRK